MTNAVSQRQARARWRRFLFRPTTFLSLLVLTVFFAAALLPQAALPHNPTQQSLRTRFTPPAWVEGGSSRHLLGTDNLGRDLLSRIVRGARASLLITTLSVLAGASIGVVLGLLAGYFGGWLDEVISRLIDVQLAFPLILLMIAVVGLLGASLTVLVAALSLAAWPRYARLVRGSTLSIRGQEFVEGAKALGGRPLPILFKHVAPNVVAPVIVFTTFELSRILLIESALSFLGLGVPPPQPSWGSIIADGRSYLVEAWWVSALPGIAIILVVLAFNFLGDGLRDYLDPRFSG
jgi:ABC-type dipeptide/oligopeptide/nickel transport system permease subunit